MFFCPGKRGTDEVSSRTYRSERKSSEGLIGSFMNDVKLVYHVPYNEKKNVTIKKW